MKAVILAAGLGTRLRPYIGDKPKVMLEYAGKPLLQITIESVRDKGVKDIVLVVCHNKDTIREYFGDGKKFGVNIEYVEQENPKGGTADATRYAKDKISEDKFMLIYGDNIFSSQIIDELLKKKDSFSGVLCGKEVEDPRKFGVLEVNGNHVKRILEKPENPPSNMVMTGLFIMPKEIFSAIDETKISPRGELELTDSIQILINKGYNFGFVNAPSFWFDPQGKDEIERARKILSVA